MAVVHEPGRSTQSVTVLYDGACPLCQREIAVYRGLTPIAPICYTDVSKADQQLPRDTTREQLMARFHVLTADGRLVGGARAFLELWAALPGWRWLAYAARVPDAVFVMEHTYDLFLHIRPSLQRWVSRLNRP